VYALRRYRQRLLQVPATGYSARAFQVGMGLVLDVGALLVFGIAAILFFFSWLDHDLRRILVLQILFIVFVVRVVALLTRFLLGRRASTSACSHSTTGQSHLRGFSIALAVMFGVGIATRLLLTATERYRKPSMWSVSASGLSISSSPYPPFGPCANPSPI
jgi:hypothetical protein